MNSLSSRPMLPNRLSAMGYASATSRFPHRLNEQSLLEPIPVSYLLCIPHLPKALEHIYSLDMLWELIDASVILSSIDSIILRRYKLGSK
jgi:hypothetical protein